MLLLLLLLVLLGATGTAGVSPVVQCRFEPEQNAFVLDAPAEVSPLPAFTDMRSNLKRPAWMSADASVVFLRDSDGAAAWTEWHAGKQFASFVELDFEAREHALLWDASRSMWVHLSPLEARWARPDPDANSALPPPLPLPNKLFDGRFGDAT